MIFSTLTEPVCYCQLLLVNIAVEEYNAIYAAGSEAAPPLANESLGESPYSAPPKHYLLLF